MNRTLLMKTIVTSLIAILLLVPLNGVVNLVQERKSVSFAALGDIQRSGVGTQKLMGPILIVPYRRTIRTVTVDQKSGKRTFQESTYEERLHFLPDSLSIQAHVGTERRYRGIYATLFYDAQQVLVGSFKIPEDYGLDQRSGVTYAFDSAYVVLGIGDNRGIKGDPILKWEGKVQDRTWIGGGEHGMEFLQRGIHANVGKVQPARSIDFEIGLTLAGTETLSYVPVGKQTSVTVDSKWPHPSFVGQLLPESRTISERGFEATWRTSHLASNIGAALDACFIGAPTREGNPVNCEKGLTTLGVAFIEPVNVYLQTERAAKYGFLFIALTFLAFQLFELFKKLAIHPVQYGLVGVALAMFFLLLLALTEHVRFVVAYLVASTSCVGLLSFYVSYVLRGVRRALGFGVLLSALYGALYVLLRSEDLALLLGAVLLFGILAAIMFVTRNLDWYRLTPPVAGLAVSDQVPQAAPVEVNPPHQSAE
jgi:inner membrane protein